MAFEGGKWKSVIYFYFHFYEMRGCAENVSNKMGGTKAMVKNTVTDKIGNEYREWQQGDTVFNTLLSYAKEKDWKILYLVNRTMLKEQLEKEISKRPFNEQIIRVELYQR